MFLQSPLSAVLMWMPCPVPEYHRRPISQLSEYFSSLELGPVQVKIPVSNLIQRFPFCRLWPCLWNGPRKETLSAPPASPALLSAWSPGSLWPERELGGTGQMPLCWTGTPALGHCRSSNWWGLAAAPSVRQTAQSWPLFEHTCEALGSPCLVHRSLKWDTWVRFSVQSPGSSSSSP